VPDDRELRPYAERVIAQEILTGAGFKVDEVRSRPPDSSPDCEAEVDGRLCGIEVTELVDPKILRTKKYEDQGVHRHLAKCWTSSDFRNEVDALICRKADKIKGWADDSRYAGRLLVIHTDEFHLTSQFVTEALQGREFDSRGFCAVVLGSYHPEDKTIFQIPLR
jgi:hypothetical protein